MLERPRGELATHVRRESQLAVEGQIDDLAWNGGTNVQF
jgi:hypothetical protein